MKPQTRDLLRLLQARSPEGVSALDALFQLHIYRAGARVFELRREGYNVRTERKAGETAVYFLEGRA
jgi:hypothetical protein